MLGVPHNAMASSNSPWSILITDFTPFSPFAANPYNIGRPTYNVIWKSFFLVKRKATWQFENVKYIPPCSPGTNFFSLPKQLLHQGPMPWRHLSHDGFHHQVILAQHQKQLLQPVQCQCQENFCNDTVDKTVSRGAISCTSNQVRTSCFDTQ